MPLTEKQLARIVERRGVRAHAAENFLRSLDGTTREHALANLEIDAALYRWNAATQAAIRAGIEEVFT